LGSRVAENKECGNANNNVESKFANHGIFYQAKTKGKIRKLPTNQPVFVIVTMATK